VAGDRLAAISVDLDEVDCYTAIHGLPPLEGDAAHAIYRRALPRLKALFEELGVPATFFVIGRDATTDNAPTLRALHETGHELANHSLNHRYDLSRRDPDTMRREVEGGAERIARAAGVRPVGFRAPGYTINDTLFDVLEDLGVGYDSSVFPCPPYYAAKAAAIATYGARARLGRGRESASVLDHPRVLTAPADPYRRGRPFSNPGRGLRELPIGVTRGLRLPYIGTSVVLAGERGADLLTRQIVGRPLVNLELHGIDLADAELDGLVSLRPYQPDLRKSAAFKERSLRAAIGRLRASGYRFVTLAQAAEALL